MILSVAKTSKAKCIRCYTHIIQAQPILKFGTWAKNAYGRGYIHRQYHTECYAAYPPNGVYSFDDINWDTEHEDFKGEPSSMISLFAQALNNAKWIVCRIVVFIF